jgi:L-ascorbate metabolism protein UlaG (beta-lactamase superfamily)
MSTSLWYWGAAGYEIVGPSSRIVIDPFLSANPSAPVHVDDLEAPDVILVSHAAFDHLGDTAALALRTGAPVVCDSAVRELLLDEGVPGDQIRATVWGIVVEVGGVVVRPVECHHWSVGRKRDGTTVVGNPLAFIVETEPGVRIYHYGDTCIFDMKVIGDLYQPTVALLGCTVPPELTDRVEGAGRVLSGEMDAREAAIAAEMLGVEVAVACHYLDEWDSEVQAFLELVSEHDTSGRRLAIAPKVGDRIVVSELLASVRAARVSR